MTPPRARVPSVAMGPRPSVLIFLHHLKTGGTTLRTILGRQYPMDAIHTVAARPVEPAQLKGLRRLESSVRLVQGHIPFGVHAFVPRAAKYLTLLRHPRERVHSLYHHVLEEPRREIHAQAAGHLGSLEEFLQSGVLLEVDNGQTRRLSGASPPFGECSDAMLEAAKRNLRERFLAVGLTERFDESLVLFRRLLGWRGVFYHRQEKRTGRPHAELRAESARLIERHNALDLELYAYAAALFDEKLSAMEEDFREEVATLRAVNDALTRQAAGRRALRAEPVWTLQQRDTTTGLHSALLDAYIACVAHDRALQWENARLRRSLSKLEKRLDR